MTTYSKRPGDELDALLRDYLAEDEWDDVTASESPQALEKTVAEARKRSGEFLKAEFAAAIKQCGEAQ
jgi:hypothetical protein